MWIKISWMPLILDSIQHVCFVPDKAFHTNTVNPFLWCTLYSIQVVFDLPGGVTTQKMLLLTWYVLTLQAKYSIWGKIFGFACLPVLTPRLLPQAYFG